jgi:tetraacyldisaccharide 4'-kinase
VLCAPRRADLLPLAAGADVLLLDDGFQHRALARDLDVVVLDASSPFGNGHLLPAGPNREPRAALRRAGLVWLTRVDQTDPAALDALRELARAATGRAPVESRHAVVDVVDGALARSLGKDALRGSRAALLSGIAKPASFRRTVEALGAVVIAEHVFADHHRFSHADVLGALGSAEWLVTTEKDAVRVPADLVADPRLRVVRIAAEVVRGGEVLDEALSAMLNSHPDPTRSVASPSASSRTA